MNEGKLQKFVKPSLIGQQSYFMNLCRQKRYNLLQTINGIMLRDKKFLGAMVMARGLINEEWNKECEPLIAELIDGAHINIETSNEAVLEMLVSVADNLIDTMYVCASFLNMFGFPGDEVWDIVQAANVAKAQDCDHRVLKDQMNGELYVKYEQDECPKCEGTGKVIVRRADGKILKPEGWQAPEAKILQALKAEIQRVKDAGLVEIPD